jgi:hypothetical protein
MTFSIFCKYSPICVRSNMDIRAYRTIVQYQTLGIIPSRPKHCIGTNTRAHIKGEGGGNLQNLEYFDE